MRDFARQHKHHLTLWIILLLITAVSGYFAFIYLPTGDHPQGDNPQTTSLSSTTALPASPARLAEASAKRAGGPLPASSTTTKVYTIVDFLSQPKQENEPTIIIVTNSLNTATNTLNATLEVNNHLYTLVYTNGDSLYVAMDKLQTNTDFRFGGRNFGGSLGYFVEEINGVKNDRSKGKYWIYYVNGATSTIGISSYILKFNDLITWKYENEIK